MVLPLGVLPKRWVSLTGLVVGITPDFEYFLRLRYDSYYSHTLGGLLWFDIPLGIALAFLFHNVVRNALFDNLPGFVRCRVIAFKAFDWVGHFKQHWFVVCVSILFGAVTLVLWDGLTHDHGFFVERIPQLTHSFDMIGKELVPYSVLERWSSILGLLVIGIVVLRLPKDKTHQGHVDPKYWILVSSIAVMIAATRLIFGPEPKQVEQLVTIMISAGLAGLVITPLLLKLLGGSR